MKYLLPLLVLFAFAMPAEAHKRHKYHHHHNHHAYFHCGPFGCHFGTHPKQPKYRINEHCVYKPWSDKTVCKY